MNKLAKLIRELPPDEVRLIEKDLTEGTLSRVVRERLSEFDLAQKVCPVCSTEVTENAPFVLYFGNEVRQKARFDAKDCLLFFLKGLG